MALKRGHRGRLAHWLLFWFLLVSVVPVAVVSLSLIKYSRRSLERVVLGDERNLAVGFADTASKYVLTFRGVLSDLAGIEGFWSLGRDRQRAELEKVMSAHAAFMRVYLLDADGNVLARAERYPGTYAWPKNFAGRDFFKMSIADGQYMGGVTRIHGDPCSTVAVAIRGAGGVVGVLGGEVSLEGLSKLLRMEFPPPPKGLKRAWVVTSDGDAVAASDVDLAYQKMRLPVDKDVLIDIASQARESGARIMKLQDARSVLAAYAYVRNLDWIVYIEEPMRAVDKPAHEMMKSAWWLVGLAILGAALVSIILAEFITYPIRLLREAAQKLAQGRFEEPPDLAQANNEIGDLGEAFVAMSESLREKTAELLATKEELEAGSKDLEKKVAARTRELRSAQDELIRKERLAAIGQMASVVGHEIRNPLAVINNSIYLIKAKLGPQLDAEPKIAKHVKIIESEIQQANGIISEILSYSRERELKAERVPLNAFLDDILSVYPLPPHIKVVRHFHPSDPFVEVDKAYMQQAISNLIGNGIEVMPAGGAVGVKTSVVDGMAALEVADTGPGMPPEVKEKIFTPFFTTKARGTGLGLAVVRKVIDLHKGKIEVHSMPGKGTSFRLLLPLAKPA